MQFKKLGNSAIDVSAICLGTMTWGEQNTESEAHEQLDFAVDAGINFIDTAEMYPVPPKAETQGLTEQYLGTWLAKQARDQFVIASKVAGPGDWLSHIRGGSRLNQAHITQAIDSSLQRLQTDYLDLYQLHWPDRNTNFFGQLGYSATEQEQQTPLLESIQTMDRLVKAGKIRQWGLSNETPWGVMKALMLCEQHSLVKPITIQNPYNLLNRTYEIGLAEISHRENIGLLAYSPLAFGALTGKYLNGARPPKGRLTLFERFARYNNIQAVAAIEAYVAIAKQYQLSAAQMSLAFVNGQSFVHSNIIGATNLDQLSENINSINTVLSSEVLGAIAQIHKQHPNPAP